MFKKIFRFGKPKLHTTKQEIGQFKMGRIINAQLGDQVQVFLVITNEEITRSITLRGTVEKPFSSDVVSFYQDEKNMIYVEEG
jgi:hypothetical protein